MKRLCLAVAFFLVAAMAAGCTKGENGQKKLNVWQIEGLAYDGNVVAENEDFRIYDFVFMHFCTDADHKEDALNKAHLFSVIYEIARLNNPLSEEEKEEILRISEELAKDNAELYLNKGFENVLQYKLFTLMENTINKYKSSVFDKYDINDDELLDYYKQNIKKYRSVELQVLFYSLKDENGNKLSQEVIDEKIEKAESYLDKIQTSSDMDDLILDESEDPGVIETGGRMTVSLEGYQNKDDEFYAFSSNPDLKTGDMTVIVDEYGIYLVRCDGFEDYENSEEVRDAVYNDYCTLKFLKEMEAHLDDEKYHLEDIKEDIMDKIITQYQWD
ncbi:MAG: hypothetical protein GX166_01500 [Clostridiaceae bacterium]|nr:hypothetical protein [Clostridiaceae bacterium]